MNFLRVGWIKGSGGGGGGGDQAANNNNNKINVFHINHI